MKCFVFNVTLQPSDTLQSAVLVVALLTLLERVEHAKVEPNILDLSLCHEVLLVLGIVGLGGLLPRPPRDDFSPHGDVEPLDAVGEALLLVLYPGAIRVSDLVGGQFQVDRDLELGKCLENVYAVDVGALLKVEL
jgi:hypothetical protein